MGDNNLTVAGQGVVAMDLDPSESQAAAAPEDDFVWTCGGDAKTKHIKKINHGAFGDVHMVTSITALDSSGRWKTKQRKPFRFPR